MLSPLIHRTLAWGYVYPLLLFTTSATATTVIIIITTIATTIITTRHVFLRAPCAASKIDNSLREISLVFLHLLFVVCNPFVLPASFFSTAILPQRISCAL